MDKNNKGFGTYSNDGFGTFEFEFSDDDIAHLILNIKTNKDKIREDFTEIVSRIDTYLKINFEVIPSTEDFVEWYFDKQKIRHLGKNKLRVTEKEIFLKAKEYAGFLDKIRLGNNVECLNLNYGKVNNETVLNSLYSKLYPHKIDVPIEEFKLHFNEGYDGSQIKWKGTETEFVNLFSSIKFQNFDLLKMLSIHFLNNKEMKFTARQLSVSKSKSSLETKYRGKVFVEEIVNEINKIKS